MKLVCALFAVAFLVAGCSSEKPVLLNPSQEGVVVRYNPAFTTAAAASAAAQGVCARYGRNAVRGQSDDATVDNFVTYSCVRP